MGIFIDGLNLKYVCLSLTDGKVILQDYKTVSLITRLEVKPTSGWDRAAAIDVTKENVAGGEQNLEEAANEQTSNATVLHDLIASFPSEKCTISFALAEPSVTYQEFTTDFGLHGTELKKRLSRS